MLDDKTVPPSVLAPLLEVRHVSVSVARPPEDVYDFVRDPRNLPRWATGLGEEVTEREGQWVADGPLGQVRFRFAPENGFGVLDHDVTVASGETFHNPMRVVPNAEGCEVMFLVMRWPGTPLESFEADTRTVQADLERLKALLEGTATLSPR